jgi:transposase
VGAIKRERTLIELMLESDVHPNQMKQWCNQLVEAATGVFGEALKSKPVSSVVVLSLHAKIGELRLEINSLSGTLDKAGLLPRARK